VKAGDEAGIGENGCICRSPGINNPGKIVDGALTPPAFKAFPTADEQVLL